MKLVCGAHNSVENNCFKSFLHCTICQGKDKRPIFFSRKFMKQKFNIPEILPKKICSWVLGKAQKQIIPATALQSLQAALTVTDHRSTAKNNYSRADPLRSMTLLSKQVHGGRRGHLCQESTAHQMLLKETVGMEGFCIEACSTDKAGLKLRNLSASPSPDIGLKAWTTTPRWLAI